MDTTILQKVRAMAASLDDDGRKHLIVALRNLSYDLESPDDTMQRFYGNVSFSLRNHVLKS